MNKAAKPKMAIIIDVEGWAFSNIANQIKKNLSDYYDIDIIVSDVFGNDVIKLFILLNHYKYDLVHLMWRGYLGELDIQEAKDKLPILGFEHEDFINTYIKSQNISSAVYDHFLLTDDIFHYTISFSKYCRNYYTSSNKLNYIYNNLPNIRKPNTTITDGVDLQKFYPKNLQRFDNMEDRKIIIGWVGNSKATDSENDDDLKGVRKIIIPCIQELIEEGYPIEMQFADSNVKKIPLNEMNDYYNLIDIYICASKAEGTPNPILESMACGVPVISTDVGIVPDVFGENQKYFILKERSKEELRSAIVKLIKDKNMFRILSNENLAQIKSWDWKIKCKDFKKFFDECLSKKEINI